MSTIDTLQNLIVEASEGTITMDRVQGVGDNIQDLGLDSLALVKLVVLIEETYGIELEIEEMDKLHLFHSFARLVCYMEEHISQQSAV